ncbi:MAG: MFS transporter [Chloroflexi bacterium]|nr:MFS transporter [Chloroflexota bacterium]
MYELLNNLSIQYCAFGGILVFYPFDTQAKIAVKVVFRKRKVFYGWWIVLSASVLMFLNGGTFYYGFTTFFNPIRQAFGWTATITSVAFTLQRLESGILGPIVGFLVDRFGPRRLMFIGWILVGGGFLLMSRIDSLWAFYSAFLVIATGFSLSAGIATNAAIANWFNRKRARALTVTYLGPGLGGILVPLLAFSIRQIGWRETLAYVGIALLVICLPLTLLVRHKPEQYGLMPDGDASPSSKAPAGTPSNPSSHQGEMGNGFTAREALSTRAFWLLAAVNFFQQTGQSSVMVHIVPYLESVNIPTTTAALAVTGMTFASLIGRLVFGLTGDFANKRYLLSITLFLQTIGLFIFSLAGADKVWLIVAFLLTFGPGYGGAIPVRPALIADYFGMKNYGAIFGLMSVFGMVGGLASPTLAGWIFDATGSYQTAWRLFAVVTIPSIPLMLMATQPKFKAQKPVPSPTGTGF